MPEVKLIDPLQDRVNIVLDELALGIKWKKPVLAIIIYRSEHIKKIVQPQIREEIIKLGQQIRYFIVDRDHYDVPRELSSASEREQTVYFIQGLVRGGGRGYSNAYRALNMHREYLVEGCIRALFWLTEKEGRQLARFSPDFWAFRHLVVEFNDLPIRKRINQPKLIRFPCEDQRTHKPKEFLHLILAAEEVFSLGCYDEAILIYRKILRKYPDEHFTSLPLMQAYLATGQIDAATRLKRKMLARATIPHGYEHEFKELSHLAKTTQPARGGFIETATIQG
jgi:hypothetical protein